MKVRSQKVSFFESCARSFPSKNKGMVNSPEKKPSSNYPKLIQTKLTPFEAPKKTGLFPNHHAGFTARNTMIFLGGDQISKQIFVRWDKYR